MDTTLETLKEKLEPSQAKCFGTWLRHIEGWKGARSVFKKIGAARSKDQLFDLLAEVRFALVLSGIGFKIEFEPLGKKGPDQRAKSQASSFLVEVTRFRKMHPGPRIIGQSKDGFELEEYGDVQRDIRKAIDKISKKFLQIGIDEPAIIAIWNDDGDMDELEVEQAVSDLQKDGLKKLISIPENLTLVLYGSAWIGDQQMHIFPLLNRGSAVEHISQLEEQNVSQLIERVLKNERAC